MRGAARKPAEEPAPAKADLDARLAGVLDGQADLVTRATALLDRCPDPLLLRQLITEVIGWGLHAEEMRAEMARYAAVNAGGDSFFAMGRAYERSLQDAAAKAAVPGQHRRRSARWQPGEGQRALFSVKTIPGIAAAVVAVRTLGRAHRLAAALAAVTIPFAAGAGTYAVLQPGTATASPPAASAPAPAATIEGAAPVPSQSLAARARPKPKHAARGKTLLSAGMPAPVYGSGAAPSSSSAPSSPAPVVSVQVAGTLVVSPQSVNLATALTGTATVRIRAWGGDASWSIQSIPPDLTLTLPDGSQVVPGQSYDLKLGQSADLTVGLSVNLDGSTLVTFAVGTTTVSVTVPLPVPVTVPSLLPSDAPSVLPSGL